MMMMVFLVRDSNTSKTFCPLLHMLGFLFLILLSSYEATQQGPHSRDFCTFLLSFLRPPARAKFPKEYPLRKAIITHVRNITWPMPMQTSSSDDCIDTFYVCSLQSAVPQCQNCVKPLYSEQLATTKHVKWIYFPIKVSTPLHQTVGFSQIWWWGNQQWCIHKNMWPSSGLSNSTKLDMYHADVISSLLSHLSLELSNLAMSNTR